MYNIIMVNEKNQLMTEMRELSKQLQEKRKRLDEINEGLRSEQERKHFEEFKYGVWGLDKIEPRTFEFYKRGTDEAGIAINTYGLPVAFHSYYGGGGDHAVARTVDEGKKRAFIDSVIKAVEQCEWHAGTLQRQHGKDAPLAEVDIAKATEHFYKKFVEAQLAGVFDDLQFEKTVLGESTATEEKTT